MLTRKARPEPIPVARPTLELVAVLSFLAIYAVGFLGWGMGAAREVFAAGPQEKLFILALKLVVHVAAPALLLAMLGARVAPLFRTGLGKPGFWPPLIVLGAIIMALLCVVSPALKQISEIGRAHV